MDKHLFTGKFQGGCGPLIQIKGLGVTGNVSVHGFELVDAWGHPEHFAQALLQPGDQDQVVQQGQAALGNGRNAPDVPMNMGAPKPNCRYRTTCIRVATAEHIPVMKMKR